jgi:hypothetical protein
MIAANRDAGIVTGLRDLVARLALSASVLSP